MKTDCPQCGAEIEFRFDDSFVRVCSHCRAAVARTDRGFETLGKVAGLMPIESPLVLFSDGAYRDQTFILIGKAQVRHSAGGLWQEWYAKFKGVWGWLAEAQGRFYMTFEVPGVPVPGLHRLAPGTQLSLPTHTGPRVFTVSEVGVATYVAADGELPFRLTPNTSFQYVDLTDGQGGFATIDYGPPTSGMDDSSPPSVYVGGQIRLSDLRISGGESPSTAPPRISSQRLACPNCNGALELRAPDAALRVVCQFCNAMLNVGSGSVLTLLSQLEDKAKPAIALGTVGSFAEGQLTVIGFVQRSARVDDTWYPFDEYLLHSPALGFRWLVCSDGHWSYVQPVSAGACRKVDGHTTYAGHRFKMFQSAELRVDRVVGEFYWKVAIGDSAHGIDYVAPPAMLSLEASPGEINWSLSIYLTAEQVRTALGTALPAPGETDTTANAVGVAPNQPWPHTGVGKYYGLLFAALIVIGVIMSGSTPRNIASFTVDVPSGKPASLPEAPAGAEPGHVFFTDPFELRAGENIEIRLAAILDNTWLFVITDLVSETTGTFISFDQGLEYYHGYEAGDSWSEGSPVKTQTLAPVPGGSYVLRLEAQRGETGASAGTSIRLTAAIRQNVFQSGMWGLAILIILLPGLLLWLSSRRFEHRRWSNSNTHPSDDDSSGDD
jgi:Domain of unknown function (DUF4178)